MKIFEEADFQLFEIAGFEERMDVLKKQLRPKFEKMGNELAAELEAITGEPVFPHVAKHARRKTNPPDDSWVAFSTNPRGYKMMPHFQVTVWGTHLLIQWGIIYEAKQKEMFARNLRQQLTEIKEMIPANYQWSKDHMKPGGISHAEMKDADFIEFADRLENNKKGEVMVGLVLPKEEVLKMNPKEVKEKVIDVWSRLNQLHKMAK